MITAKQTLPSPARVKQFCGDGKSVDIGVLTAANDGSTGKNRTGCPLCVREWIYGSSAVKGRGFFEEQKIRLRQLIPRPSPLDREGIVPVVVAGGETFHVIVPRFTQIQRLSAPPTAAMMPWPIISFWVLPGGSCGCK